MRRGCISQGDIRCDKCNRLIEYLESYLVTEELNENGATERICFDCASEKDCVFYKQEKKEQITSFFPD